ncbi:PLD-like domain-containing protein [Candidatus Electrothrix communis]|uniref:phospholipase D n=1 Tax=Candidatus Electrothrix communis TaxID=1859133 RepID=A0A3S3RCG4_9BACT|nr:PLD-like domain-containing protein [Candidatus Electrothrix communis]
MSINLGGSDIYLSPSLRGAPDSAKSIIHELPLLNGDMLVASQQISDREFVSKCVEELISKNKSAKFLIEGQFIKEGRLKENANIWDDYGKFEKNRMCFSALLRAGFDIRADYVSNALQHANFLVVENVGNGIPCALLTSANLTRSSIRGHYNWVIKTRHSKFIAALKGLYKEIWDGDFRGTEISELIEENNNREKLLGGAEGQVLNEMEAQIKSSNMLIDFAVFNISQSSSIVDELIAANARGVKIRGIVDGDQSKQNWDAVPKLQAAGIDVKYYPGALTGASGRRMHYKMLAIDQKTALFSTSNISSSAQHSLELGFCIESDSNQAAAFITHELERLIPLASKQPLHQTPF